MIKAPYSIGSRGTLGRSGHRMVDEVPEAAVREAMLLPEVLGGPSGLKGLPYTNFEALCRYHDST